MYTWTAPQTMKRITKTGLFTFVNKQGKALRKKCNVSLLKPLLSEDAAENDEQRQLQKSNLNEKHSKHKEEDGHLHDETYIECRQNLCVLDKNHFNKLPDEIV